MKNADTRVQYTETALKKALLKLMSEKPIAKITVKEITETAGLNRGTFYLHYDSPYALLEDIENSFMQETLAKFAVFWDYQYDFSLMQGIFSSLEEHKEMYRVLMGENGDPKFLKNILEKTKPATVDGWLREWPDAKRKNAEMAFDMVFAGTSELILKWINGEYNISAQELCDRIERFGHYAMVATLEF